MQLLESILRDIKGPNEEAIIEAEAYLDFLAKPVGSLGKLEHIATQLAGITGMVKNTINKKAIIVMAADHGVYEEGVASTPQNVTAIQAINMVKGRSGVSVLAQQAGATLRVYNIGIKGNIAFNGLLDKVVAQGSKNMVKGPAMTKEQTEEAILVGFKAVEELVAQGYNLIGTGEMGIANTTPSSAIYMAFTGCHEDEAVGKGAGLTESGLRLKKQVIKKAIEVNEPKVDDPLDVLSKVGGFDIAGLVGCYLGAAYFRVPIVVDGLITAAAAYTAYKLNPFTKYYMIPSHISKEPAYSKIIKDMGLYPMLDMEMRLGEGSGCPLAFHIIESACAMMNHMATFADIELDDDYMIDIREG